MSTILYSTIPSPENVHALACEKGWYEGVNRQDVGPDFIPCKLALVHSELSEALEDYRKNGMPPLFVPPTMGQGSFGEELADAVIRIFDLAGFIGIDLETQINLKHEYNKERPHRHGGKKV